MNIIEGKTFIVTRGCYSEYRVEVMAIAKKTISYKTLEKEFKLWEKDNKFEFPDRLYGSSDKFINWLLNLSDYAEKVKIIQLHTGDYGDFELSEY